MFTNFQRPIWEEACQTALDFVNSTLGTMKIPDELDRINIVEYANMPSTKHLPLMMQEIYRKKDITTVTHAEKYVCESMVIDPILPHIITEFGYTLNTDKTILNITHPGGPTVLYAKDFYIGLNKARIIDTNSGIIIGTIRFICL